MTFHIDIMAKEKAKSVDKELLEKISKRIKGLRGEKKITQEVFYNDTGIHIARIESCERNLSISSLKRICDYFEISLEEFFSKDF